MNDHPAKKWPSRLFWKDLSDQPNEYQIIDLLHDIRFLLLLIAIILAFKA
nr:hypothetical protein [Brucella anthropi]